MRSRTLLAVDVSNQVYKAAAVHAALSFEGVFTGGIYGFLVAVSKAIIAVEATDLVLCVDRKPYLRSELYPDYKKLREGSRDPELYERAKLSEKQVLEMAESCGIAVWQEPGFESDDLVAHAVIKYRHRFDRVVAMSNDSDLYQLFNYPGFSIYKGKRGEYRRSHYDEEWKGFTPDQLRLSLALTGTHNDVAGIPRVGEVTSREIVLSPFRLRQVREKYAEIIDRNERLITLPYEGFPKGSCLPEPTVRFSERNLIRHCSRYDLNINRLISEGMERIFGNG